MFLVERMTMAPNRCLVCGSGNVEDGETKKLGPFIDLGIDYNWGDSAYLCMKCAGQIALLAGWCTPDEKKDLEREIRKHQKTIHNLEAKVEARARRADAAEGRLESIAMGTRALREEKAKARRRVTAEK
jgi:hypothetical protein